MAQDFAKRSRSRAKKPAPRRFSLGSFVLGVVTGVSLFLAGAYAPDLLTSQLSKSAIASRPDAESTQPSASPANATQDPPSTQPNVEFVFRDLLGADEVDPDLTAYESEILAAQNHPATPGSPSINYLLQSGSFRIKADAESRMGTLLLLNLPTSIVEARIDNKIWYRVIVGPYDQRGQAQQAVTRLKANAISSIWMERPGPEG